MRIEESFSFWSKELKSKNSLGTLYAELEALKKRMAEEGYFSGTQKALQKNIQKQSVWLLPLRERQFMIL